MAVRDGRITSKQQQILDYIKEEILKRGYPPAVREICEAVGLKSTSSVHAHLESLEKKGFIRRDPSKTRAIEIIDDSFTTDDFIAFCSERGIESYSIADDSFTADLFERLREGGLISYVFTVNDPERARVLLACGVDAVGSDFIRE